MLDDFLGGRDTRYWMTFYEAKMLDDYLQGDNTEHVSYRLSHEGLNTKN